MFHPQHFVGTLLAYKNYYYYYYLLRVLNTHHSYKLMLYLQVFMIIFVILLSLGRKLCIQWQDGSQTKNYKFFRSE